MLIREIIVRWKFFRGADRIGPDILFSQVKLHFKSSMLKSCKKKFKYFAADAELRPGSIAIGCSKISLGRRVVIRPTTMLLADTNPNGGGITIEDDVMLGAGVIIYADKHVCNNLDIPIKDQGFQDSSGVTLKEGCWIGAKSIICPDVEIGENSVVAACSVVKESVPPRVVVAGNPARILKRLNTVVPPTIA